MKLQISCYKSSDILLMQNGHSWADGASIAEHIVAFADTGRNPVAIEVSGAASLLRPVLYEGWLPTPPESCASIHGRPALRLIVKYDREADVLTMESGLPMPFEQTIADGLTVFYDGEDEYGKFVNGVKLEDAAGLLEPYLSPYAIDPG